MLGTLAEKTNGYRDVWSLLPRIHDAILLMSHLRDMWHEPLSELMKLRLTRDPVTWVSLLTVIRKRNRALWHRGQGLYVLGSNIRKKQRWVNSGYWGGAGCRGGAWASPDSSPLA